MTNLLSLAERVEQASGPSVDLFREVYVAVHGPKPERVHGGSAELTAYLHRFNPFYSLITHFAWLDAATMLVPEGWEWSWYGLIRRAYVMRRGIENESDDGVVGSNRCATPALALTAACLKALSLSGNQP